MYRCDWCGRKDEDSRGWVFPDRYEGTAYCSQKCAAQAANGGSTATGNAGSKQPISGETVKRQRQVRFFITAAKNNDIEELKSILRQGDVDIDDQIDGKTALAEAIEAKNLDAADFLLSYGAKADGMAIWLTVKQRNFELLSRVIESIDVQSRKKALNYRYKTLSTPLEAAFGSKEVDLRFIKLLVQNGAIVDLGDEIGYQPIHRACYAGNLAIVKFLVEQGADVSANSNSGKKPIHEACYSGNLALIKFLIDQGAEINPIGSFGDRPIHVACDNGHLDLVKFFIENGVAVDVVNRDRQQPIHAACRSGNLALVQFLVNQGADPRVPGIRHQQPLHWACLSGKVPLVEYLVSLGVDINAKSDSSTLPIHYAYESGNQALVEFLISRGVDNDNPLEEDGRSLLHYACKGGNLALVKSLVKAGASISQKTDSGWQPIHDATEGGHIDVLKFLVAKGADVNAETEYENRPLTVLDDDCRADWTIKQEIREFLESRGAT